MRYLEVLLIFFALICSSGAANSDSQILLDVESVSPLTLSVMQAGRKMSVIVPLAVVKDTEDIYTSVTLDDIDGDGVDEVVMTIPAGGGVNSCSKVFRYDLKGNALSEVVFSEGSICNYRKEDGYLISSYRGGSAWVEDIYKFERGVFGLAFKDACIGCGYISRRAFDFDGVVSDYLVSDSEDFKGRTPIVGTVLSRRAFVYSEPFVQQLSKKYLVQDDKYLVRSFSKNTYGSWVKVRYKGKVVTEGWLRCSDVESCAFH
ncbi:hypothetical protein PSm6_50620 [Pseudomonas solani]|uniref:VCBS repeat-containing protein n=1 Tax=Pseudomonas solani TaxID=2731552 RepID=A0ABM7LGA7_9PSED|nr:hypothetical protein [Pseudomonas solani]BCD88655.1 hypothetical protein PSm6_50620 [Pseudomonas solani]